MLDANFWNQRYIEKTTGWDLGSASPSIVNYFKEVLNKELQILIPGCGNAYEAEALLDLGFENITLIDIAPKLVSSLQERYKNRSINVVLGDFFELKGSFDVIVEQTFFCALDPELRTKYVNHMHSLLKPKGKIVGLMFNAEFEGGPPFSGNRAEYEELFSPLFSINIQECTTSVEPRMGNELWVEFEKG